MTPAIRRRRWPLFFEPRRRFKRRIMRVMRTVLARLRYLTEVAAAAVKGRGVRAVLVYGAYLWAAVKRAGRGLKLWYRAEVARAVARRAGRALRRAARYYDWLRAYVRARPAPRLSYWFLYADVKLFKRLRAVPYLSYWRLGASVWVGRRVAHHPRLNYYSGMGGAFIEKRPREEPEPTGARRGRGPPRRKA